MLKLVDALVKHGALGCGILVYALRRIVVLCFVGSAIINRCGFNSEGIVVVAKRLGAQHGKRKMEDTTSSSFSSNDEVKKGGKAGPGILGVNIGKNKTSEDAAADYVQGVHTLSQYADYLVLYLLFPQYHDSRFT